MGNQAVSGATPDQEMVIVSGLYNHDVVDGWISGWLVVCSDTHRTGLTLNCNEYVETFPRIFSRRDIAVEVNLGGHVVFALVGGSN